MPSASGHQLSLSADSGMDRLHVRHLTAGELCGLCPSDETTRLRRWLRWRMRDVRAPGTGWQIVLPTSDRAPSLTSKASCACPCPVCLGHIIRLHLHCFQQQSVARRGIGIFLSFSLSFPFFVFFLQLKPLNLSRSSYGGEGTPKTPNSQFPGRNCEFGVLGPGGGLRNRNP